jgi:hypothetical protein
MSGGSVPAPDPRLVYLGRYVQKTLKLKPEKWNRLLSIEEHKTTVMDFLNKPEPKVSCALHIYKFVGELKPTYRHTFIHS